MTGSDWESALNGGDKIKMIEVQILRNRMDIYELRLAELHSREKLIGILEREIDDLIESMKAATAEPQLIVGTKEEIERYAFQRQMTDAGGGLRNFPAGIKARNLDEGAK